jgi:hypothetical protein
MGMPSFWCFVGYCSASPPKTWHLQTSKGGFDFEADMCQSDDRLEEQVEEAGKARELLFSSLRRV